MKGAPTKAPRALHHHWQLLAVDVKRWLQESCSLPLARTDTLTGLVVHDVQDYAGTTQTHRFHQLVAHSSLPEEEGDRRHEGTA